MGRFAHYLALAGAGLLFLAAGCSTIEEDLCEAECACEGCSESEQMRCVQEYDADLAAAEHRDCGYLYDDLQRCRDATGVCVGNDWKTSCKAEKDRLKKCVD